MPRVNHQKILTNKKEIQMINKITNLIRIKKMSHLRIIGFIFIFVIFAFASHSNIASADSAIGNGSYTTANAATWSAAGGTATISGSSVNFAAGTYDFGAANILITGTLYVSPSSTTAANSTGVELKTTGNITVSGTIYGTGRGYAAGSGYGNGYGDAYGSATGWNNAWLGGGHGGYGGGGTITYGSATGPITLGSGGAGVQNSGTGGAGGGAIKLNAPTGTVTITGIINMDGFSSGSGSGGAGGSIWIIANTLTSSTLNSPTISASGGTGSQLLAGGGGGRISMQTTGTDTYSGNILVAGGTGMNGGAVGTVNRTAGVPGDITIANGITVTWSTGEHPVRNLTIVGTGVLTTGQPQGGGGAQATSNYAFYGAGVGGGRAGYDSAGGAGHGGTGGSGNTATSNFGPGGSSYDSSTAPTLPGSGGGGVESGLGGTGGGYMKLTITGVLNVSSTGTISANGLSGRGGGSGGSIFINAPTGSITGGGTYSAVGGAGGGGAGGRIAFNSPSINFSPTPTITVAGASGANNGGIGTITGVYFSTIDTPTSGQFTKTLAITGTAKDYGGGTVQSVGVSIKNNATGYYWNGSSFVNNSGAPLFTNSATNTGTNFSTWSYTPVGISGDGVSLTIQSRANSSPTGYEVYGAGITMTFDNVAPTLSGATIAANTNTHTPSFTFTTSEAGTIAYGGSCSSATTTATSGANTVVLNSLVDGTYSNCTVTVTDAATNASTALAVTQFTVDTVAPLVSLSTTKSAFNQAFTVTATFNEAVNPLTSGMVTLGGFGVGGTVGPVTTTDSSHYSFLVTPPVGDGTVTVNILANAVTDLAGNGNVIATSNPNVSIGDSYGGGKIGYILINGDPGYVNGQTKGLIAATIDQSTGIVWHATNTGTTGATGTAIGTGLSNTNAIIALYGAESNAATLAKNYNGGSYTDWYLPSEDELNKLYLNRVSIGGFSSNYYWSSSENGATYAWYQNFGTGNQTNNSKSLPLYVRAVRSFVPLNGLSISYDSTRPTVTNVTYSKARAVKTGESQVITATFSEDMATSPKPKIIISGANTLTATDMTIGGDNKTYSYTHTVLPGDGTATVSFSTGTDIAGNLVNSAPTAGATFIVDNTPPALSAPSITTPTNTHTPSFTFTSSEAGTITYGGSCSSATTSAIVGANTVVLNSLIDGTYSSCTVTVTDTATNASTALAVPQFTVDTVAPTVSLTASKSAFNAPFTVTATFSEPVNAPTSGNITLGGVGGSVGAVTTSSSSVYTFVVTPSGDGTITVNILANAVTDLAGNGNISTSAIPAIGDSYGGGKIAYILASGDSGYDSTKTNGLIASLVDQSTGIVWGCSGLGIPGALGIAIGTGAQNTKDMIGHAGCSGVATVIDNVNINGYSDWYLPSKDELNKLWLARASLGISTFAHWTSTAYYDNYMNQAWSQGSTGVQSATNKNVSMYARAVRSFSIPGIFSISYDGTRPTATISYSKTRAVKPGEVQRITATFSEPMADSPVPQISISGATSLTATNMVKSTTSSYYYDYTVGAGNGTDTVALSTGTDIAGNLIMPAPTSGATFVIDNSAPTAAITYSLNRNVKSGDSQVITATFSEDMADSPKPKISISGANTLVATDMTKGVDAKSYYYDYTVLAGDGTATVALSTGTDIATNIVTSAPTSGATFTVDNTAPIATVTYSKNPVGFTTNTVTVTYGEALDFPPTLGQSYGGGIVAYFLVPGDTGYVAGQTKGYITTSQANDTIGSAVNGAPSIALASAYRGGGYSDWYLPSRPELTKIIANQAALGLSFDAGMLTGYLTTSCTGTCPGGYNDTYNRGSWSWSSGSFKVKPIRIFTYTGSGSAPTISINQPGSTDITTATMTSSDGLAWTYPYAVQKATGGTYIDGTANVAISSVTDAAGNAVSASSTFVIDTAGPTAAITYSINHAVKQGNSQVITATFNKAMADSPVPQISISGNNTVAATNMTKVDTTHYTYTYTVGTGDGTDTVTLSNGVDTLGNLVTATPNSGASFVVDNTAPLITLGYTATTAVPGPNTITATYNEALASTTPVLNIGDAYQGGKVAYILQQGDTGYVQGQTKGLIAATSDQSNSVGWCSASPSGARGIVLGTGQQNTTDMVTAGCGGSASLVNSVNIGGYTDWYLPSKDELNKLYLNRVAIGNFSAIRYWSSTFNGTFPQGQDFSTSTQAGYMPTSPYSVRAVRSFTATNVVTNPPTVSVNQPGTTDITTATMSTTDNLVWTYPYTVVKATGTVPGASAYVDGTANVSITAVTDAAGNAVLGTGSFTIETIPPTITAPITGAQRLKSGIVTTSNVQIDKAGDIYIVKHGTAATTLALINTAITAKNAFKIVTGATANSPITFTIPVSTSINDGAYDFVAVSTIGNISDPTTGATSWLTIDNTAPVITVYSNATAPGALKIGGTIMFIVSPSSAETNITGITPLLYNGKAISWITENSGVSYKATYTVVSGDTDQTTPLQLTGIVMTDQAGNPSIAVNGTDIAKTIDANAPTNQDTVFPADVYKKAQATVSLISGNALDTVWFAPVGTTVFTAGLTMTSAGGAASSIASPQTEGTYKLFVIDAAGNVSAPSTHSLFIDATAPIVSTPFNTPQILKSGATSSSTVQINETGKIYLIKRSVAAATQADLDAAVNTNHNGFIGVDPAQGGIPSAVTLPALLVDGIYDVVGVDTVGNISAPFAGWLTVDNTIPTSAITAPVNLSMLNGLTAISGTSADVNGIANVKYSLKNLTTSKWYGGSSFNSDTEVKLPVDSGTLNWNTTLADTIWTKGATDYTLTSYATDVAQNSEVTGMSVTFTVDKTAPSINSIVYAYNPANAANANRITVTYSKPITTLPKISVNQQGDTDIASAQMTLDHGNVYYYDYAVHSTSGNLYKDGVATVSLDPVSDSAGNVAELPKVEETTFVIDTVKPTSTISLVCDVVGNGCTADGAAANPQQSFGVSKITGDTADVNGSGVSSVNISIQDTDTLKYFDDVTKTFSSFDEKYFNGGKVTLSDDKLHWSYDSSAINFDLNVNYEIHSQAVDAAGNKESNVSPRIFMFANSPPTISNVVASTDTSGNVNVSYNVDDNENKSNTSPATTQWLFYDVGAKLSGAIDNSTSSITLSDASKLSASGYIIIDNEIMHFTKTANTLSLTRGTTIALSGTTNSTPISHASGADVFIYAPSAAGDVGLVTLGTNKLITWHAKTDIDGYENLTEKLRVVANDGATGSMISLISIANPASTSLSNPFNFNTKNPTATGLKINGVSIPAESTTPAITLALEGISGSLSGTNVYAQFSSDGGTTWYGGNANGTLSAAGTLGSGFSPSPAVAEAITWPWVMQARSETIKVKLTDSFGNTSMVSNSVKYNSAPEFDSTFGTDGVSVSQISDKADANFGKVKIDYKVRDVDNVAATPTFSYDVAGGTSFTAIDSAELSGVVTTITPSYAVHTVYWTPAKGIFSTTNANFKISLNDAEPINSTSFKTITPIIIDTTDPQVGVMGVTFDAGAAGTTGSGNIHIVRPADISDIEYKITDVSNDLTADNTNSGVWVAWNNADTTKDIAWTFDSRLAAKSITYQFRDKYGNGGEVDATPVTLTTLPPVDEQSFLIQDTTNTYLHKNELYIGWGAVTSPNFRSYKLEFATSANNYATYQTVVDSGMNDPTKNFYIDNNNLNSSLYYNYRIGVVDNNGNTSVRAGAKSSARPNGVQDGTEGGGVSIPVASVVENVVPTQDATTRNVTVTYKLSDSSYSKKSVATYESRLFYNLGVTLGVAPYSDLTKTLKVSDVSKFSSTGGYIQINNEVLKYTGKDAVNNLLTGIVRGTWPASTTRFTRQNSPFFSGTPVWMMAVDATPTAIEDVSTIESTGVTGTMTWNMANEPLLLDGVYTNVGVRVLVHDNQPAQSGPLSTQNDLTESGVLNTLDLSKPTVGFTTTEGTGDETVTSVLIPVSIDHSYVLPATVAYTVSGTAVRGVNYTLEDGTVTFTPGDPSTNPLTKNITLTILNDNVRTGDKTIIVTLSPSPTNAILGTNSVYTYTLKGEGEIPAIAFNAPNYSSGSQTIASVNLPLNLSSSSTTDTTVDYTVSGTAIGGEDYTLAPGTVTIHAGSTTGSIPLAIINSGFTGDSRTVIVNLTNPTNAVIGNLGQYVYTILNKEIIPTVQFQNASATGSKTTASVNIPVTLSTASTSSVTVAYTIKQSSTAIAGTDYILSPGTVTFAPGVITQNIPVIILNSALKGLDKTLSLELSNPTNATMGTPSTFDYQILDDQSAVKVFFPSPSSEGLESTSSAQFIVALSSLSSQEISVDYTVTGTAVSGVDYTLPSGTLKIPAGRTVQNIIATIINNSIFEPSKTIVITLSNPVNAILDDTSKVFTYTILNDDTALTVSFDGVDSSSDSRTVSSVSLPVALSSLSGFDTSVSYTVSGTATSGVDYALAPGTITINKGIKTGHIPLTIINSSFKEPSKTVIVTLTNPVNATLATTNTVYTYTILNPSYVLPTVAFQSDSGTGSKAVASVNIPVVLSASSTSNVTVAYAVKIDPVLTTAVAGSDYVLANGTLTFGPGSTTQNIPLSIINNALKGVDKKVSIELSNPAGATLGTPTLFTYNIIDDQSAVKVFFPTASSEGLESTSNASFTVALSSVSSAEVSVDYAVTGTAISGVDYTLANGTLRIPAGSPTKNILASIINNDIYEPTKTMIITLSNPVNAILDDSGTVFTYKILNDDTLPTVAFSGPNSSSGAPTDSSLTLPLVLSAKSGFETSISYTVTGTAVSGVDYAAVPGTITIPLGSTTASIPLTIINSGFTDSNKTIIVTLTSVDNATLATTNTVYTYTIQNPNFVLPTVEFDSSTGTGREDIAGTVNIPVVLSEPYTEDVTISYAVTGGLAQGNGVDYTLNGQTLTIPTGQIKGYIPLIIIDDNVYKGTRNVIISLSSPVNAELGAKSTFGYSILDNEIATTETNGSNIKSTSARILWTTADYADSLVEYGTIAPGTEGAYNLSKSDVNKVLNHNVYLGNLTPSTTYYFRTTSVNLNNETSTSESQFTTTPGPVISAVSSSEVTDTGATITWTTDIPTSSYVNYTTDPTFATPGRTGVDELVTAHSVKLTKLSSQIEYYYSVDGTDKDGNVGEDAKGGDYYNFTTTKDFTPPIISDISTPIITATQVAIIWSTNEPADGRVRYGTAPGVYDNQTELISKPTLGHLATINGLTEKTTYYYMIDSADVNYNSASSEEKSFTTPEKEQVIINQGGGGVQGVAQELYDLLLAENASYKAKFGEDLSVPTISDIQVADITPFSATVSFTTSKDSIAFINYGKDEKYGLSSGDSNWAQTHSIVLHGLSLGTKYNFQVSVFDKSNNLVNSDNQTFTTKYLTEDLAALKNIDNVEQYQAEIEKTIESILPSLVPPFIDKPVISDITENSATVTFRTNVKAFPVLAYTTDANYILNATKDNPYDGEISDTSAKAIDHTLALIGLRPNTKYHVMAKAFSLPQVIGKSDDITFTTAASKIQGSVIDVKNDSFTVVWSTDNPTSSIVSYKNLTTGRIAQIVDDVKNTSHFLRVENLTPGTVYQVNISGINEQGNLVEGSSALNVKTSVDVTPPVISNLKVDSSLVVGLTDKVQTIISWQTDEPSTSKVDYQEGSGSLTDKLANNKEDVELTKNHVIILTSLRAGTVYRFIVESADNAGNINKTPIRTIITPKKTESIVDVIFKNFDSTFNFINGGVK